MPESQIVALNSFFRAMRALSFSGEELTTASLPGFATGSQVLQAADRLTCFSEEFRRVFQANLRRGEYINVWNVAGLGRNELAVASVVAWIVNERGSHGRGSRVLNEWVSQLRPKWANPSLAKSGPLSSYRTATEVYPFSATDSRVDIELDGSEFVLFVEVKVDAAEGPNQIAKYLAHAQAKAGARRYALIFVSRFADANLSTSSPHVTSTTWHGLARAIRAAVRLVQNEIIILEMPYYCNLQTMLTHSDLGRRRYVKQRT